VPLVQGGITKKTTIASIVSKVGAVTSVTGTAPVVSSGGATPAISMAAATTSVSGYLTSTDWNTFNNKQPAGSYLTSGGALGTPSSGTATNLTGLPLTTGVTGQLPVANGGTGTATPSIVAGTNVTVSGTWPNQTINATGGGGAGDVSGPGSSTDNAVARFDSTTGKIIQNSGVVINDSGEVTVGVWKGTEIGLPYGGTGASTASQARGNILPSYAGNAGKVLAVNTGATDVEYIAVGGSGTVTSVAVSGGTTGLTTSGGPITASGTITLAGTLAVASGGTGTSTPSLVQGTNVTITGSWPNQTINATAGGSGTVTSVSGTGTVNGLSLTGTVTSSGNLTLGGTLDLSTPPAIGGTTPAAITGTTITANTKFSGSNYDASGSGGGALRTSAGSNCLQWGGGGGVNLTLDGAFNMNPANATIQISPTGTGTLTVNPATAGTMNNMAIGGTTPAAGAFTTLSATTAIAVTSGGTGVTTSTGTGSVVLSTSPTLVTPILGTPTSATLTNATGLPISTGVSGLGTGVATALAVNVGTAGSPVINGGALGTPSSGTLTNATGLPIATGVSGLGTGVATFLATPSSANLISVVSDETGSGLLVFNSAPALTNPTVTNYIETPYSANSSTAITLALTNGTVQIITLTGNATITMPTATSGKSFILLLKQDATGSRTVTWTTVKWPAGTAPTITSTASKQDIYSFFADGTNWYGVTVGQNYTP
jgi:hypothetical protein